MISIAELLEITGEIVVWKDRRDWWVNQAWLGGVYALVDLIEAVCNVIQGRWLVFGVWCFALAVSVWVMVGAIRGIKRADDIIAKLTESAVRL